MKPSDLHANSSSFGHRKEPPVITLTSNGKVRKLTIKPLTFAFFGTTFVMFIVGYLAATAYLVLRDDLIGGTIARNARMQNTYEDRIAALRSQIDRITSKQLIEQKALEARLNSLAKRQKTLGARQGIVAAAFGKAGLPIGVSGRIPLPSAKPQFGISSPDTITTGSVSRPGKPKLRLGALMGTSSPFSESNAPGLSPFATAFASPVVQSPVISAVENSLKQVELQQFAALQKIENETRTRTRKLSRAISRLGGKPPKLTISEKSSAMGGPAIELKGANGFSTKIYELNDAMADLEKVKRVVATVPLGHPVPGQQVTSRFGPRRDPFTKRWSVHSGMDFRAPRGFPVKATADGVVTIAKRQGGYGKMVEITHGNGLKTRFAHLSRILVKKGQRVKVDQIVAKVGSTGRSTGPHLHYEVRLNGQIRNPNKYIRAKKTIATLL